jgi:hypothetical protein
MASLVYKLVDNRKNRPVWVMDDAQLMLHCIGERHMLRYQIAIKYWRENKSAREIAAELGMTLGAVEKIIQRLAKSERSLRPV